MADKFEKTDCVSCGGYCFEFVWKKACDGVVVQSIRDNVVLRSLWLKDIVFDSREQAMSCLKGPYTIALFYEEESYGERCPGWSDATITFNDELDLYKFTDDEGRGALAKLVPRTVILWKD